MHKSLFLAPGHESCAVNVIGAARTEGHPCGATVAAITASFSRALAVLLVAVSGFQGWQSGRVGHTVQRWALTFHDLIWSTVHDCRVLNLAMLAIPGVIQ